MNRNFALLLASAALGSTLAHANPAVMKPGLWEVTVVNQAANTTNKRSTVSQVCYKADDLKVPQKLLPPQGEFGMVCEAKDYKATEGKATWKVSCGKGAKTVTGTSEMTATATSYTGTANVESKADGKSTKLKQTLSGKRLGDCK